MQSRRLILGKVRLSTECQKIRNGSDGSCRSELFQFRIQNGIDLISHGWVTGTLLRTGVRKTFSQVVP